MTKSRTSEPVKYEIGGLYRCCVEAVSNRVGTEDGERIPCPHHADDPGSGVKWSEKRKAWIAAWREDG